MPATIGVFTIVILPCIAVIVWLLVIRPYCRRNGKGYTPGANAGVTFWVDWQEAKDIAKRNGDNRMMAICNALLVIQIAVAVMFLAIIALSF